MRGYFGIGVEGINKPYNVGNVFRTAHAFGASFVFTVAATYDRGEGARTDTSDSLGQLPFYDFPCARSLILPKGCVLVGIEIDDKAVDLPSFRHPLQAAYVMGPERGSLSVAMTSRCDHLIRVPTRFSLNVGIAGVCVMYDRLVSRGRFAPRPVSTGGPTEMLAPHAYGDQLLRQASMQAYRQSPPLAEVDTTEKDGLDEL